MRDEKRFFQMLGRLVVFARTYPQFFDKDTPLGRDMGEVEAAYLHYVALAASLRGGETAIRQSIEDKKNTREELRNLMDTISRIAQGFGFRQFFLPKDGGEAALVSVGKMWAETEVLQRKFAEAGLTAFVDQLKAMVTKTHLAIDEQTVSRGARVQAAHGIMQTRRAARMALLRLDALMRHELRRNPPVLAVWERARRIERSPFARSAEAAATAPGGPAASTSLAGPITL